MRGQRSLFDDLLPAPVKLKAEDIGRNPVLIRKRDKLIAARYYHYFIIKKMPYKPILNFLSDELHISLIQVQRRLDGHRDDIRAFRDNNTTAEQLQVQYPWMVW